MKTLLLKCAGPLQSWGNDSNYDTRRTAHIPTKSAIVGLLAAALGYRRDEDERIQALNSLDFAVRVDQSGSILRDYHMVRKESLKKSEQAVYITQRYYLQDAVFIVAIGSEDEDLMDKIEGALSAPYFQPFLGRRSVPVTADFVIGSFDLTPIEALKNWRWEAVSWYQRELKQHKVKLEIYADADLVDSQYRRMEKERVISFSQKERKFSYRPIGRTFVEKVNPYYKEEHDSFTAEHDAFSAIGG